MGVLKATGLAMVAVVPMGAVAQMPDTTMHSVAYDEYMPVDRADGDARMMKAAS